MNEICSQEKKINRLKKMVSFKDNEKEEWENEKRECQENEGNINENVAYDHDYVAESATTSYVRNSNVFSNDNANDDDFNYILKNFNPAEFGIKGKLSDGEKRILIKEIFGVSPKKSVTIIDKTESKKTLNERDEKKNTAAQEESKKFYNSNEEENTQKKKKKKRKGYLSHLDGDCYFPDDGYDYEQHLRSISEQFVPAKNILPVDHFNDKPKNEDEEEAFQALEMDDLEELNDDFILTAQNVDDVEQLQVDEELIWGKQEQLLLTPDKGFTNPIEECNMSSSTDDTKTGKKKAENGNLNDGDTSVHTSNMLQENHIEKVLVPVKRKGKSLQIEQENEKEKDEGHYLNLAELIKRSLENQAVKKEKTKKKKKKKKCIQLPTVNDLEKECKIKILQIINANENEEGGGEEKDEGYISDYSNTSSDEESSYNCETILTTKTNTTNHPYKVIIPNKIVPKPILPKITNNGPLMDKKENEKKKETLHLERYIILDKIKTVPDKNETPEEKRARKKAVKEAQRLNRKIKKENALLLKVQKKAENELYGEKTNAEE